MNGYTNKEIAIRNKIDAMIIAREYDAAIAESKRFMSASKARQRRRYLLLKSTVAYWITVMDGSKES